MIIEKNRKALWWCTILLLVAFVVTIITGESDMEIIIILGGIAILDLVVWVVFGD